MVRHGKGETKRRGRKIGPGVKKEYYYGPTNTTELSVKAKRKLVEKSQRTRNMVRNSAYAMERKEAEEAERSARALRQIRENDKRYAEEASSYLPPLSESMSEGAKERKRIETSLIAEEAREKKKVALAAKKEQERIEAQRLKQERDMIEARKKAFIEKTRKEYEEKKKAKKSKSMAITRKKEQLRLEKKYELEHLSYETEYQKHYNELVAKGIPEEKAETQAELQALFAIDPRMRKLRDPKTLWGNFMNSETPPPLPKVVAKKSVVVPVIESRRNIPTRKSYARVAKEQVFDPAFKKLTILNLPTDTGRNQVDTRKLVRSVYGTLTGVEIFRPTPVTKPVIVGIAVRGYSKMPARPDIYLPKSGTSQQVTAFVTYQSHEEAQKVLDHHRARPIKIKGQVVDIQPTKLRDDEMLANVVTTTDA
jgi:hypothetical protein